ncbi:hypothetical protein KI387_026198, partial [Taxus chinensis]
VATVQAKAPEANEREKYYQHQPQQTVDNAILNMLTSNHTSKKPSSNKLYYKHNTSNRLDRIIDSHIHGSLGLLTTSTRLYSVTGTTITTGWAVSSKCNLLTATVCTTRT